MSHQTRGFSTHGINSGPPYITIDTHILGVKIGSGAGSPGIAEDVNAGYSAGSIYIDTTNDQPWFCMDATAGSPTWVQGGGGAAPGGASVTISTTPPSSPSNGDLWFYSEDGSLNVYYTDPDAAQWVAITGPSGPKGLAATVAVGTTTTGSPATSANVTNSGSSSAAVFDFDIPRGSPGKATAGSTTTGSPAEPAQVTDVGSPNGAVFDFVIPRGSPGSPGADGSNTPRGFTLENPQTTDKLPLFFNDTSSFALSQLSSLVGGSPGGSPSCQWYIKYDASFSTTGTSVITAGVTTTQTGSPKVDTSFNNGTIPANNIVWIEFGTITGTVPFIHVSVR